jgi:hypothetical protein
MNNSKKISTGLTDLEVLESAKKHGSNSIEHTKKNHFLTSLLDIVKEPMFILLFTATSVYFITGDYGDGIFMAIAIVFVIAISVFPKPCVPQIHRGVGRFPVFDSIARFESNTLSKNSNNCSPFMIKP